MHPRRSVGCELALGVATPSAQTIALQPALPEGPSGYLGGPADLVEVPRPAALYLPCPHCRFPSDQTKSECISCGLVFAKWASRSCRPQPVLLQPAWATAVTWLLEAILAHRVRSLIVLIFTAVWTLGGVGEHAPVASSFAGPWNEAGGLRFRVVYLWPEGFVHLGNSVPSVPERLRGAVPLYHGGDKVKYRIEVQNLRATPIGDLRVIARQEAVRSRGGPEVALGSPHLFDAKALAAGEETAFKGHFRVSGRSPFEQTHLTFSEAGREGGRVFVVDEPLAAIIDPPVSQ